MKIVSTSDYVMDLGSGPETVKRGQEFTPQGNGIQNAEERAKVLLAQKVAVLPKDWPVYRDRTQAQWDKVQAMVAQANRDADAAAKKRQKEAEERAKAREGAR